MAGKAVPRPRKLSVYLYIPNIIGGYWNLIRFNLVYVYLANYLKLTMPHLAV